MKSEFGTMIEMLSLVTMVVARMDIMRPRFEGGRLCQALPFELCDGLGGLLSLLMAGVFPLVHNHLKLPCGFPRLVNVQGVPVADGDPHRATVLQFGLKDVGLRAGRRADAKPRRDQITEEGLGLVRRAREAANSVCGELDSGCFRRVRVLAVAHRIGAFHGCVRSVYAVCANTYEQLRTL